MPERLTPAAQIFRRLLPQDFPLNGDVFSALMVARHAPAQASAGGLEQLLPTSDMLGLDQAARLLSEIQGRVTVVADYDCDGATAAALAIRGLRALRPELEVDFVVPDRQQDGYGLSESIVTKILNQYPSKQEHCLLTVDNGIASLAGVQLAVAHGLRVIITDHHLPAEQLPPADAIVNPNQLGCKFASKALAGVGVMFYLLIALRAQLRATGSVNAKVNLLQFSDLVALGTVADLVPLDGNNRMLVEAGLQLLRTGRGNPGIQALIRSSGRAADTLRASDLGFYIGPRINAAGRLLHMKQGIECLLAQDQEQAQSMAQSLEAVNTQRKQKQGDAIDQAISVLPQETQAAVLVAYDPHWHEGIVGLVAGKLKEQYQRPAFAFAHALNPALLKGSGRSVSGLHLRDMLDYVSKKAPNLLLTFGGHAMAAGLSIAASDLERFQQEIDTATEHFLRIAEPGSDPLSPKIWTDGGLRERLKSESDLLRLALQIERQTWGQGFAEPLFDDTFDILRTEILGEKHMRVQLRLADSDLPPLRAIRFFSTETLPPRARLLYHLTVNRWNGKLNAELQINSLIT
jgi:single-stranded-DNA-specific exonuclease